MNHYCTYFDRGFLPQGVALWRSLRRHDPGSVLWVLGLDLEACDTLARLSDGSLRVLSLDELESADVELSRVKSTRSRMEYYFTLSPCLPRWLLRTQPEIERITYVDADMLFFSDPAGVHLGMEEVGASILVTEHRLPTWLRYYNRHGRFNVGILSFRNDAAGIACLERWRQQCLAWCEDKVEGERYADQGYLTEWPERYGAALHICRHPGVNLAPWNWLRHEVQILGGAVRVDGAPLVLFHFARFRPVYGQWLWQSGQLDYGVMPARLRNTIYSAYALSLDEAVREVRLHAPSWDYARKPLRLNRAAWRETLLRLIFGSDWIRVGSRFYSARFGLSRWSGYVLAKLRNSFLRRKRATVSAS